MARIRAKLKQRILFAAINVILVILGFQIVRGEEIREWKQVQRAFKELHIATLNEQIDSADSETPQAQVEQWRRTIEEVTVSKPKIRQIFLPQAKVHDLCTTCHLGIEDPLFADAPQPFRTHPGDLLRQHKVNKLGCTLCHQGLGVGTTLENAHGHEESWPEPLVPVKYLQSTCIKCHESPFMLEGAEKLDAGRKLFINKGCYACHGGENFAHVPKFAAPLDRIAGKLSGTAWLFSWLEDTDKLRAAAAMPNFHLTSEQAGDVISYLFTLQEDAVSPLQPQRGGSAERGEELFVTRGCRACHSVTKDEVGISARVPNLSDTGLKVRADWLMTWLEDPRAYNPNARMPKPELTRSERSDLTAYLMTLRANAERVGAERQAALEGRDPAKGKAIVQNLGCYACHPMKGFEDVPAPGVDVVQIAHKKLEDFPFGHTDVPRTKWDWIREKITLPGIYETEDTPLKMPKYIHTEAEIEALTTFYLNNERYELVDSFLHPMSPRQQTLETGDRLVARYNCRGCHMLEEGQEPLIAAHLDRKSQVPPRLVGEGEKVQPRWLFDFLHTPERLRPWLDIKMPDFGFTRDENQSIVDYFAERSADSGIAYPFVTLPQREDLSEEEYEMGVYRVSMDKCSQCHPMSQDAELAPDVNPDDISINLMLAKTRLRPEWIKNFLRNPDRYAGVGTRMPFIYFDPAGKPKISDAEMWIDLTTTFLMVMEELPEAKEESLESIRPGSEIDWTTY